MYNIFTERQKKVIRIVAQPELQVSTLSNFILNFKKLTLIKKYLWAEWDPTLSLLYYIMVVGKDIKPNPNGVTVMVDCNLRCCSFADSKRPNIIFDYNISVS